MSEQQGKWFANLAPDAALADAARVVISARAGVVGDWIAALTAANGQDPQHVHQLRVSSRRLVAALDAFRSVLTPDCHRRFRKAAARLRRAAGAVRDLDVQRAALSARLDSISWFPPHFAGTLEDTLLELRQRAQSRLLRALPGLRERFDRRRREAAEQMAAPATVDNSVAGGSGTTPPTLGERFEAALDEQATALRAAGAADLSDADNVHRLRIAAKRLRYLLEIFAGCLEEDQLRALHDPAQAMQERLGKINDLRHLFATLADVRWSLLKDAKDCEREDIRSLMDRLISLIGFDWIMRQQAFHKRWTETLQSEFEGLLPAAAPANAAIEATEVP